MLSAYQPRQLRGPYANTGLREDTSVETVPPSEPLTLSPEQELELELTVTQILINNAYKAGGNTYQGAVKVYGNEFHELVRRRDALNKQLKGINPTHGSPQQVKDMGNAMSTAGTQQRAQTPSQLTKMNNLGVDLPFTSTALPDNTRVQVGPEPNRGRTKLALQQQVQDSPAQYSVPADDGMGWIPEGGLFSMMARKRLQGPAPVTNKPTNARVVNEAPAMLDTSYTSDYAGYKNEYAGNNSYAVDGYSTIMRALKLHKSFGKWK